MQGRNNFHTQFHVMEARGIFRSNPANPDSQNDQGDLLYAGPVEYPKMLYHPLGEMRTVVPAEIVVTPMGPKEVGEQRELIYRIVVDADEEEEARSAGWHEHPSDAIAASGKEAPAKS